MEVRKICQWCGKPFIAKKTTTCYCSHQCSNLGYKERIRERKRQLKKIQELLEPKQAAEGQDFFSFAQAAQLMGVTRQYVYKLVKESKLRASRISGKKSLIRRADIELMLKTNIIRKSKFPQNPKRSVRFSGKRTKRSVQKRKARNTQKAETKVL